jgi:2-polyprenyl-6-methoxyphenol hydroxylase-like FAD-dependent oxidoreductase
MAPPNILVSGAGVCGPVLAYFLRRSGARVTVIERSPSLRLTGQSVDIRNAGVDIMKIMKVLDQISSRTTQEAGIQWVNGKGTVQGTINATGNEKAQSFTSEYEILRGELAKVLVDRVVERWGKSVKWEYGGYISSMLQSTNSDGNKVVEVTLANSNEQRTYDIVIAADGLGSKLRSMMYGGKDADQANYRPLDGFAAYFTIEHKDLLAGSKHAKWLNAPGGRGILLRPDPAGHTRAIFTVVTDGSEVAMAPLKHAAASGAEAFKQLMQDMFQDAGWLAPEVLRGMHETDDFYFSEFAQIHAPRLYKERVVLVGDAGYCPTSLTGMGTTLAIVGAYILAGEIMNHHNDLDTALQSYEEIMLRYARKSQSIPLGGRMPKLVNPQTSWGVSVLHWVVWGMTASGLVGAMQKLAGIASFGGDGFKLPSYEWPEE